jgi:T5orf172 domain
MPVYFIAENENDNHDSLRVKIGRSGNIQVRLRTLQTGSPYSLKLMGWIESDNDKQLELTLHERFSDQRIHLEWFYLQPEKVLNELQSHGICAYIATEENTFEIMSRDKDGVPEYYGPWKWGDVEDSEFCPKCGCTCGLHYNENYGTVRCLNCGIINEYDEKPREEP